MIRILAALVLAAAAAAESYTFTADEVMSYRWTISQHVEWGSAGDRLAYDSSLDWRLLLRAASVSPQQVILRATVVRVLARHSGPGSEAAIDSADPATLKDPLLGHLAAAEGATLELDLDPLSGSVRSVGGGEEIARRIAARSPSAFPGEESPLAAAARGAYASPRLAVQWTWALGLPRSGDEDLVLAAPLVGSLVRHWNGSAWTLSLPKDVQSLPVQLMGGATPVSGSLGEVAGKGALTMQGGLPLLAEGEASFSLQLQALTQPVAQRHALTWRLERSGLPPAPVPPKRP